MFCNGNICRYDTCYEVSAIEKIECARIYWLLCLKVVHPYIVVPVIPVATYGSVPEYI